MVPEAEPFWKSKPLQDLTETQWEDLCDGCGKCCLHKLQDAETGDIFYTAVACPLLDIAQCRCRDYAHRFEKAPHCLELTPGKVAELDWLPATCAYRLVSAGKDLPDWHHLVCNDRQAVHAAGMSIRGWAIAPDGIDEDDLKEFVVVPEMI